MFILSWLFYGLLVGLIAKLFYNPKDMPAGFLSTMAVGVVGSYVGGFINWILGNGDSPFEASGIIMGVLGGVIFCWVYTKYKLNQFLETEIENKDDQGS